MMIFKFWFSIFFYLKSKFMTTELIKACLKKCMTSITNCYTKFSKWFFGGEFIIVKKSSDRDTVARLTIQFWCLYVHVKEAIRIMNTIFFLFKIFIQLFSWNLFLSWLQQSKKRCMCLELTIKNNSTEKLTFKVSWAPNCVKIPFLLSPGTMRTATFRR